MIYRLAFEGVNISCEIFVNGQKAGSHVGGYVGFTVDITQFLERGKNNHILLRVDNSIDPQIIPSQKSDFVIFGGIVRDVWLQILPPVFIERAQIRTPLVNASQAKTRIEIVFENRLPEIQNISLSVSVNNPAGKTVGREKWSGLSRPGENAVTIEMPLLHDPQLWSPEEPNLYIAQITLKAGNYSDMVAERLGYRWYEFKAHGPFYLNGKRVLLRGTHRHEDYAGYGNAMPDSLHRKDMRMIKKMGANFVRLAHYPQDPEVYRACDELGLLVWDELPWCRGGVGDETWKANTRRLLKEQIVQNVNHPSIILWSLGNEIYWLPDFPGGGNVDSLRVFVGELNGLAHQLDPGRLTSMRKFYEGADIVDVFSPSIWSGWYSGVYKNYEQALNSSRENYQHFFHAEYGGSSHVGRHTEHPVTGEGLVKADEWAEKATMIDVANIANTGDWSENYIVDLFDWYLMVSEKLDWLAGNAQWAFKDFPTPLRPENPIPYMNQKGLVDRAGNPKDAYYVFKSRWTTEPKFCYIESHTWTERSGLPGQEREVCVFSNCDAVRLVLNRVDQGYRERDPEAYPAAGLSWHVLFAEGRNDLLAIGYAGGKQAARDSISVNYRMNRNDGPAELNLSSKELPNGNVLIEARVVDADGRLCLDFNERVYFAHNGAGELITAQGTPSGSDVIEFANGKAAIELIPAKGKAVIEARTQDFKGSYIVIEK
ncbi:beta-galactosidase [candidate division KSB1 bacterium RBG_16_48_16]|nr:MAG: beta-galactosidase [candidate division KSB1 bacterium RBG_16_48_16]